MNERKRHLIPTQPTSLPRKFLWLLILTILAVAAIIIFPITPTPRPAVDSKILGVRVLLCLIGIAAAINWKQITRPNWQFLDTLFAGMFLSFGLSTLFSGTIGYCLMISWHQVGLVGVAWLIYRMDLQLSEIRSLSWSIGLIAVLASLYGLMAYSGHDVLKTYFPFSLEEEQEGGRNLVHSFYGNPEYFAGFISPCLIITAGLILRKSTPLLARLFWISAVILMLIALVLSGSRSALMACAIGCAILGYTHRSLIPPTRRKLVYGFLALMTVIGLIGLAVLSTPNALNPRDMRLMSRFGDLFNTQTASVRERINFYISTANSIYENPVLGSGPGTYRLNYFSNFSDLLPEIEPGVSQALLKEMNNRLAEHAHNDYLEYWSDYGTIGLAIFLLIAVHLVVRMWNSRRSNLHDNPASNENLRIYQATFFCASFAILLNAFTSFPFQMPERSTLAWIIIGTFFAINRHSQPTAPPTLSRA